MKKTFAIFIKFFATLAAAFITFYLYFNISITAIIGIAVVCTAINYLVGDFEILPKFGNTIAALMDGVTAILISYLILVLATEKYISTTILFFGILIAFFEFIFHIILIKAKIVESKISDSTIMNNLKPNFNTETADELHPYSDNNSKNKNNNNKNNNN